MIDGSSPYILILIVIFKSSEWYQEPNQQLT